jgi:RimJ/RimL family protein N-acetyltransferase
MRSWPSPPAVETTRVPLRDGRTAQIRPAVPDDAEAITNYVNVIGAEGKYVLRERATWSIEEERRTLAAADGRQSAFFVAEISGRLSGLISLARGRWAKDAHQANFGMSCLPACRGVGLGTALLVQGIAWARSVGVRKLSLEVFATNDRAIALYRKMGFEEEARLRGQYIIDGKPVDEVVMAQWL